MASKEPGGKFRLRKSISYASSPFSRQRLTISGERSVQTTSRPLCRKKRLSMPVPAPISNRVVLPSCCNSLVETMTMLKNSTSTYLHLLILYVRMYSSTNFCGGKDIQIIAYKRER